MQPEQLTVSELKTRLKELSLPVTGRKVHLLCLDVYCSLNAYFDAFQLEPSVGAEPANDRAQGMYVLSLGLDLC